MFWGESPKAPVELADFITPAGCAARMSSGGEQGGPGFIKGHAFRGDFSRGTFPGIATAVEGNLVKPGRKLGVGLVPGKGLKSPKEDILADLLGLFAASQETKARLKNAVLMMVDQMGEGLVISRDRGLDQGRFIRRGQFRSRVLHLNELSTRSGHFTGRRGPGGCHGPIAEAWPPAWNQGGLSLQKSGRA